MASQDLRNQKQSSDERQSGYPGDQQIQRGVEGRATTPTRASELEQHAILNNPRLHALQERQRKAQETLTQLQAQRSELVAQIQPNSSTGLSEDEQTQRALSAANATVKRHIALLTKYNEIKDIAQGLMGLIAEQRGVRVGVVMEEFGMGEKD